MSYKTHPISDVISKQIGEGTTIWQFVVVLQGASIGSNCNINCHCFIENDVIIGNNVTLKCGVFLWDGIRIEDNVFIGPNVTFINNLFPRSQQYPKINLNTILKQGVSIGANSTISGGITIGEYAMVGAGSMVTKNIASHELWYGVPAVFKGYVCKCGNKLNTLFYCEQCNITFKNLNNTK